MFFIPICYIKIRICELYALGQEEKEKRKKIFINRKNRIAGAPNYFIPPPFKEYIAPIKMREGVYP